MAMEPRYVSTKGKSPKATLKEAVLNALADDGSLYLPQTFKRVPREFILNLSSYTFQEIAFEVAKALLADDLEESVIKEIVNETITFDAPLVQLDKKIHVLELFHGPTLAFKDFGARFMARLMAHLVKDESRPLTVLVATSGDTGAAVAQGFWKVPGVQVYVLYPSGKISELQEKQITTLGENITAFEVAGTFDDCQRLVKKALLDPDLKENFALTSANSINLARLYPQVFYYFYAYSQLDLRNLSIAFSVPSGNFGNLTAGLIAKKLGLPIARFLAATNVNDAVPRYLETSHFMPKATIPTYSNAMDVGHPSNFERMKHFYRYSHFSLCQDVWGKSYSDKMTLQGISAVYEKYNYIMDPHSAIGYLAAQRFLEKQRKPHQCVCLETAHPAKFPSVVKEAIGVEPEIPASLQELEHKEKESIPINSSLDALKENLFTHSQ
jgi:threonine synthase